MLRLKKYKSELPRSGTDLAHDSGHYRKMTLVAKRRLEPNFVQRLELDPNFVQRRVVSSWFLVPLRPIL
jgi:hypothetical protein